MPNPWRTSHGTVTIASPAPDLGVETRPGLTRLAAVELRKMVDTRTGFWPLMSTVALMAAVAVLTVIFGESADQTLQDLLWNAIWLAAVLLPVVGILLVSWEWSQRTGMVTFAVVPRRERVLAAKVGAAMVLSVATVVLSFLIAGVATAIAGSGADGTWSLSPGMVGQAVVYLTTSILRGDGFGAAFLASAPAIVLYFVLPLSWTLVGSSPALEGIADWLDGARTLGPMTEHLLDAGEWARVATTLALWMVLPLIVGLWRITRGEIR